jgi:hypothetical protein
MSMTDKQAAAKLLHDLLEGPGTPMNKSPEELATQLGVRVNEVRAGRIKAALTKVQAPFLDRLKKIMPGSDAAGEA